jgi:hypothetical protein
VNSAWTILAAASLALVAWSVAPVAEAQAPMSFQLGHKWLLTQWQDGKRAIVGHEELAPTQPRFPTPPWNQRP